MTHIPTGDGHVPDVRSTVHRFDKIEIIFPKQPEQLRARLPLADLEAHAVISKLEHFPFYKYRAKLTVVDPDYEYWRILEEYEAELGEYKICHIELACDFLYETEDEADQAAEFFLQRLRKKRHRRGAVKVAGGTAYWEDRKAWTNLKVYVRLDKRTGEPLVRIEWTLKHATHIRKQTGIITISEFRDFDFILFLAKHFLLEEINYEVLARWLNNIPVRAKVVEEVDGWDCSYAPHGRRFCRGLGIDSAAKLRQHFKDVQEEIRARGGPQTIGERRYDRLSRYKLDSFFRPLELKGGEPFIRWTIRK